MADRTYFIVIANFDLCDRFLKGSRVFNCIAFCELAVEFEVKYGVLFVIVKFW